VPCCSPLAGRAIEVAPSSPKTSPMFFSAPRLMCAPARRYLLSLRRSARLAINILRASELSVRSSDERSHSASLSCPTSNVVCVRRRKSRILAATSHHHDQGRSRVYLTGRKKTGARRFSDFSFFRFFSKKIRPEFKKNSDILRILNN
jgi:hypothetical protein